MGRLINTTSMTVDGVHVRLLEAKQFDSGVLLLRYEPQTAASD